MGLPVAICVQIGVATLGAFDSEVVVYHSVGTVPLLAVFNQWDMEFNSTVLLVVFSTTKVITLFTAPNELVPVYPEPEAVERVIWAPA